MTQITQTRKYVSNRDAVAIWDATHVDVLLRHANGQEWRVVEDQEKHAGIAAAQAIFDTLTLTGKTDTYTVHIRYYTPEVR